MGIPIALDAMKADLMSAGGSHEVQRVSLAGMTSSTLLHPDNNFLITILLIKIIYIPLSISHLTSRMKI